MVTNQEVTTYLEENYTQIPEILEYFPKKSSERKTVSNFSAVLDTLVQICSARNLHYPRIEHMHEEHLTQQSILVHYLSTQKDLYDLEWTDTKKVVQELQNDCHQGFVAAFREFKYTPKKSALQKWFVKEPNHSALIGSMQKHILKGHNMPAFYSPLDETVYFNALFIRDIPHFVLLHEIAHYNQHKRGEGVGINSVALPREFSMHREGQADFEATTICIEEKLDLWYALGGATHALSTTEELFSGKKTFQSLSPNQKERIDYWLGHAYFRLKDHE